MDVKVLLPPMLRQQTQSERPAGASRVSHRPAIARTSTPRFLAQFGAYAGDAVRAVL